MRSFWAVMLVVSGCGRFGYDPLVTDCSDPACVDGGGGGQDAGADGDGSAGGDAGGQTTLTVSATADTGLNSFAPDLNYGGAEFFNVRTSAVNTLVGLVRFDLTMADTVEAAELRLTTNNTGLGQGQVVVYRVLEDWTEGQQNGGTGVANWSSRQTGTAWTSAGCGPGSRDTTELARFTPDTGNTVYTVTLPADAVQGWLDSPSTNYGLALVAEGTGAGDVVGFWSIEHGVDVPELAIELAP